MKQLLAIVVLSLSLLSCKKEMPNDYLPPQISEAKIKTVWQYSDTYPTFIQINKCTNDTVTVSGTIYYNASYSQTTTLYTSDYTATYDSLTAVGQTGRVYKISGFRTKHLEAGIDGDALTLRVLNDYREMHLKAVGSKNDYIFTSLSKLGEPYVATETCK